ncbi:hypothetical protein [Celeribacter ethanolicus]|uniref:hypothetical protein n=1 Tax=Celeribacter ethanolicus TaxID=1758178 RepID=UPI00083601BA|nr:hypothetical protein [Celeribacter ethanolicus]
MDGEVQKVESGRARVKRVLIGSLEEGGMGRKRGVSVADHEATMEKLANRLSYMTEDGLKGLAMYLIRMGGEKNVWPDLNIVLRCAWSMEPPPPRDNDFLMSLMRSRAGEAALTGGYALQLYAAARKLGPPPSKYEVQRLRDKAQQDRDRKRVIEDRIKRGVVTRAEQGWLDGYMRMSAEAEALIREGIERREAGRDAA